MNKKEYLDKLVGLLTGPQLGLYERMYPNGPKPEQIRRATEQVETTLFRLNRDVQQLRDKSKELEEYRINAELTAESLNRQYEDLLDELQEARERIKNLSTTSNRAQEDINKSLDKLARLEAGGVDNWNGYDYAMRGE